MAKSLAKTPAPAKDRIYGSKVNPKGSASSEKSAKNIQLSAKTIIALSNKLKEFKETHNTKKVSLNDLKAVYRRGLGAYSSTHRPTITGGVPNSRNAWAMARVNAFLRKAGGGEHKKAYVQDDDLLKYDNGGEINEEAQQLIDIISINPKSEKYQKYRDILMDKYNIDFDSVYKDEEYIENATLSDIKQKNDFLNYDNYVKYAHKIFRLRGFIENQPNHIEGIVNFELASKIGKELGFKVVFKEYNGYGNYAEQLGDEIRMPKEVDINVFIHEIGHFFDHVFSKEYQGKAKNSVYATSLYMLGKSDEVFAENFMTYFIAPDWLKNNLPIVYYELDEKIPKNYKEIINNLIDSQNLTNLNLMYKSGGSVDDKKETYKKWKSLVNMSYSELEKFYNSEEGKKAGLSSSEAKAQGISSGRESARMILKMKSTPNSKWTDSMWKWANKQISFISRMSGMKGDLYDDKGNKTRKHTSLLIWGHNPKKYMAGGETSTDKKFNDPIIYHEKYGNFFVRKNSIYFWLYDNKDAGKKLNDGEFDFVMFPPATLGMAMQRGFVPPLQLIWTKKYQKNTKGSEHLIGIIEAFYDEENKKMYIKMMTTNPKMKGKGIMSYMIKQLRKEFDLSQDDLIFVDTTKEGKRFEQAKHYEEGGLIAPNGRKSNLTPEQYKLVRTPEFKAWFGDWENDPANASKVVDENGEPLVVWHGFKDKWWLKNDSFVFNPLLEGKNTKVKKRPFGAIYFSSTYNSAKSYSDNILYPFFLNFRNPKVIYAENKDLIHVLPFIYQRKENIDYYDESDLIVKNTYDSYGFKYKKEDLTDIFVTSNLFNKVKIADGTNTTFDGSNADVRYEEGGNIYENVGFTEEQIENWKDEHRVKQRQEQNPNVKESALKLKSGEISQDEYIKSVRKNLPIVPFTEVPQIPTLLEIVGALQSNQLKTGIIGYTKFIDDGEQVATRLDIPAYNNYDVWIVSVHDAKEKNAIGYGQTAYLKDINFITSPKVALNIATERSDKTTFARMKGSWINKDPHEVREMAVKYMNDPEWVQVGMNPYRHSWFYDKSDGMPLLTADELIQVGALVLAKNPVKTTPDNPIFIVPKSNPEVKFDDGGIFKSHKTIEQIAKEKNVSLRYAKEQLIKGMEVESEHSSSKEVQETIALQHLDEMIDYYDKLKTIEK